MRSFKRLNIILFFVLAFCCSIVTAESGKIPVDVSKTSSRDDSSVTRIPNVEVQSDHVIHEYVSEPYPSPKVQRTESHAIKLYSNDWWVAVYGSVNGVNTQMMALSTFTILSGVFLCTMGYRLEKPSLGIMGYLTFGMAMWAALANCKPPNGYPNDLIVMIAVPMCAGIVGAIVYFMFSAFSIYFSGALGGLALAFFICSWKYDLLIENMIGRVGFMVGLSAICGATRRFLPRESTLFTNSFVGAYVIMLGVDCIARKGYIAAFESLINFNPNSQIEYTVSSFVYIFLALTLVLFFISYGWQHFFNLMLPGILDAKKKKAAQKKMEEQQRAEYQAQLEAYQNAQAQQTQQTQQGQQGQQGQ